MGGRDETGASATVTQASIDRRLSPHLPRVLFHSQATVMGLLEAADAKFKQALAPLVDLSLWQARPYIPTAACASSWHTRRGRLCLAHGGGDSRVWPQECA